MNRFGMVLTIFSLMVSSRAFAAASCTLTVAAPVSFGNYLTYNPAYTTAAGQLTVACSSFTGTYTISLSGGTYGTVDARKLGHGISRVGYALYQDPGRTVVWGNGNSGTQKLSGSCAGSCNATYAVYGEIPADQEVPLGSYSSTITATLSY